MTDKDRERLAEVMARSMCWGRLEDPDALDNNVADAVFLPNWTRYKVDVLAAIAAAERAGFRWEAPKDG